MSNPHAEAHGRLNRISEVEAREILEQPYEELPTISLSPKFEVTMYSTFTVPVRTVSKVVYALDDQTYWYTDNHIDVYIAHNRHPLHRKP